MVQHERNAEMYDRDVFVCQEAEINSKQTNEVDSGLSELGDCVNQSISEKKENLDICVSRRTTYFQTLFHLIKCHVGSGIFTVGDVFHYHSGLWIAPLLTVCLGIVCVCDNHILADCTNEIRKRKNIYSYPTFPETMELAFKFGPRLFQSCSMTVREIAKGLNILTQLGCCIVYFIFISSALQSLLQMLARHGIIMDEHLIIVIIFFPIVMTIFMFHLKFLTIFSVMASVFFFCAVSLTLYISSSDLPPPTPRPTIAHWSQIPLFFGTSVYCFEGIVKTLPLHGDMSYPDKQVRPYTVLIVILAVVGSLFVVIAFICFMKFVDDLATHNFNDQITFSFIQHYLCSEIVHLTIALGLLFSYTLQFHIALMLVWPELVKEHGPKRHTMLAELCVRLLLALCTFTAVEVVPKLGVFMSLTGAVCGTLLALLMPPLCDLALHWDLHPSPWKHLFDFFSIFLAVTGFFTGMFYTAVIMIKGFPDEMPAHR
ncbi:proton-coupled amino acid transporter 1-like [Homalodisca vitripennis]|uniref:proton-coupled amino acid transporter 1-like n=1 Tax=Homalodisca vitripennis TaxID=197043 RepID=UPI001EEB5CEA|nr:proton-coupled amino acid transporter 1-like [Homalodisca vitripennis]XP_046684190.1 proton-coupled amino acid transporter 1-like [Homalodisca vitripennis]